MVRRSVNTLVNVADMTRKASPDYTQAVNRAVGAAIREAREARALTQGAVAESIGLSRASVANIERGQQTVAVPLLMRLADVFGVPCTQLLREPDAEEFAWLHLTDADNQILAQLDDDERAKRWVARFLPADHAGDEANHSG